MSKAIEDAIRLKREMEEELRDRLRRFTAETGLCVANGEISPIETTRVNSRFPEFGDYKVRLKVTI